MYAKTLTVAVLAAMPFAAAAQSKFPEKPIRVVVSAPPGTAPDIVIRLLQPKMVEILGQPLIIDNKPGANGSIAATEVGRAPADGYTMLVTVAGTMTANPYLYPAQAASAVTDLAGVTQIATVDFVVAAKTALGITTLPGLIAYAKANPGKLNMVTTAHGSFPHIASEMLKNRAKLDVSLVQVTGGAAAGQMLQGGHADLAIETAAVLNAALQSKAVVPLASTGLQRSPRTPDLPTIAEGGVKDVAIQGWVAVVAPRSTPLAIRTTIQQAIAKAMDDATIKERLGVMGFVAVSSTPEAFDDLIKRERADMEQIIRDARLAQP